MSDVIEDMACGLFETATANNVELTRRAARVLIEDMRPDPHAFNGWHTEFSFDDLEVFEKCRIAYAKSRGIE